MSVFSRFNKKGIANLSIAAGLLVAVSVVSAVGAGGLKASGVPENLENKEYQELSKAAVPSAGASVYASPVLSLYEEQEGAKGQGLLSAEASDSSVTGAFDPSAFGYTNLGICKVSEGNLNIRKTPSTDGSIVGKLRKNDAAEVLGEENGFTKIKSGEVEGYVKSEYLYTGEEALNAAKDAVQTVARITASAVNVRKEPSATSEKIGTAAKDSELIYVGEENGFARIDYNGGDAYVSKDYVEIKKILTHAITITEARYGAGVSDVRADLVNYAMRFLGNPYVWGGTSLTKGIDCSGFTMKIYERYGVSLPHYSVAQAQCGTRIKASQAKPGDLFFYGGSRISHVAIYIGNGQVIHASSPRVGIIISSAYMSTPVAVVRLLDD